MARFAPFILLALGLSGCAHEAPRLAYDAYTSRAMRHTMRYAVYTPPGFDAHERLPVVLFLHGGGDDPTAFDDHDVGEALDAAVAACRVPRAVIVLPEGDLGFWRNWADHTRNYESWVLGELLPHVQRVYHTLPCPRGCRVMGVSMGGAGTLMMAIHHPELFESAAIVSAPIMDTDQMLAFADNPFMRVFIPIHRIWGDPTRAQVQREDPFLVWQHPGDVGLRLFIAWAEDDAGRIRKSGKRLHHHLEEHGIPHGHEQFAGDHDWKSWTPVILDALRFMLGGSGAEPATAP